MGILSDIRHGNWDRVKSFFKTFGIVFLIIFIILILVFRIIEIHFVFEHSYEQNILFTILNAFILGVYFSVLGILNKGTQNNMLRLVILIIICSMFISGFGYTDIQFTINLPIFHEVHRIISTSSLEGIYFVSYNLWFFLATIGLSFLLERESIK